MGRQGHRISLQVPITGNSQSGNFPVNLGIVDQIIVTSDTSPQTITLELINEKGDILLGPKDLQLPDNTIRPELFPIGVMTARITNALPTSGTVTLVALVEEK